MNKFFLAFIFILLTACATNRLNNLSKDCLSAFNGKIPDEYSRFLNVTPMPFRIEPFLKLDGDCTGLFLGYYKGKEISTLEKVVPILKTKKQIFFYNPVNEGFNKSIINFFKSDLSGSGFATKAIDSIEQRFLKGIFIINKM
jgi:hypothetical protein